MARKKEIKLYRCGDCANVTPVTDKFHLLSIKGEPTVGTCPFWKESRCVLLSWVSDCRNYKHKIGWKE